MGVGGGGRFKRGGNQEGCMVVLVQVGGRCLVGRGCITMGKWLGCKSVIFIAILIGHIITSMFKCSCWSSFVALKLKSFFF